MQGKRLFVFLAGVPASVAGYRDPWAGRPCHGEAHIFLAPIAPLVVGAIAALICYAAAGVSLGLFLGGVFWAALLAGPLVAGERGAIARLFAAMGLIHGIAGVWFVACAKADFPFVMVLKSYAALTAFVLALAGITALLDRLGPIVAGAITSLLALAWFFWPVWASPLLTGGRGEAAVQWLVPAHPGFAVNAVVREKLGYWVEQSIAYHYTNLSDDVAYSLPESVWPCVGLHIGIGGACAALSLIGRRKARSPAA